MDTKHFFTDIQYLNDQLPAEAFGPADELDYNLTSLHTASQDIPVYATCKGSVFAQQNSSDPGRINLVLKPETPFFFGEIRIKYIVYKGIRASSLIDTANSNLIAPEATNDLTGKLWDYIDLMSDQPDPPTEATINFLGLNFSSSGTGDNLKSDADFIDEIFGISAFVPPIVSGGNSLGMFCSDGFGVEIITADFGHRPTFGSVRSSQALLTVADLTPINTHELKMKDNSNRRLILNYIDPLAFYSMLYPSGVEGYNETSLPDLLNKFANPGRTYIDVRNEGTSYYNGYDNYSDDILLDTGSGLTSHNYRTSGWPILIVENGDFTSSPSSDRNMIRFCLPEGDNPKPLIYQAANSNEASFPDMLPKHAGRFLGVTVSSGFTSEVTSVTHNIGTSVVQNVSRHVKIYYVRQKDASYIPANDSVLLSEHTYFDALFPLDIAVLRNVATGQHVRYSGHLCFIDAIEDLNFSGMAEICFSEEANRVTFFAMPVDVYEHEGLDLEKLKHSVRLTEGKGFYDSIYDYLTKTVTTLETGSAETKVVCFSERPQLLFGFKEYDCLFCLSLSKSELNNLLTSGTFDTAIHDRFLSITQVQHFLDDNDNPYSSLALGVQGMSAAGTMSVVSASSEVFTNSGTIAGSAAAMAAETGHASNPVVYIDNSNQNNHERNIDTLNNGVVFRTGIGFRGSKPEICDKFGDPLTVSDTDFTTVKLPLATRVTLLKMEFLPLNAINKRRIKIFFWHSRNSYLENGCRLGYLPLASVRNLEIPRATPDFAYNYPVQVLESFLQDVEFSMYLADISYVLQAAIISPNPEIYSVLTDFNLTLHDKIDIFRTNLLTAINSMDTDPSQFNLLYEKFSQLYFIENIENYGLRYNINTPFNKLPVSGKMYPDSPVEETEEYLQMVDDLEMTKKPVSISLFNNETSFTLKNEVSNISSQPVVLTSQESFVGEFWKVQQALREIFELGTTELVTVGEIKGEAIYSPLQESGQENPLEIIGYVVNFYLADNDNLNPAEIEIESTSDDARIGTDTFALPISYNWFNRNNKFLGDKLEELDEKVRPWFGEFYYPGYDTGAPLSTATTHTFRLLMQELYDWVELQSTDEAMEIRATPEYKWLKTKVVENKRLRLAVPIGSRVFSEDLTDIGETNDFFVFGELLQSHGSGVNIDQSVGILNSNPLLSTIFHECKEREMLILFPGVDTHSPGNRKEMWEDKRDYDVLSVMNNAELDATRQVSLYNYHIPLMYIHYYLVKINA